MARTVRNRFKGGIVSEWVYDTENPGLAFYSRFRPRRRWNKGETGLDVDHYLDPKSKEGRKALSRWTRDHGRGWTGHPPRSFINAYQAAIRMQGKTEIHNWIAAAGEYEVVLDSNHRHNATWDWN